MTMTDGWVVEQISTEPTMAASLIAASAGAPRVTKPNRNAKRQSSDGDDAKRSVGKWIGGALTIAVVAGAAVVALPLVAARESAEPVVASAPQGPVTQRLVLDGDTMFLEGSVPNEAASLEFENVASDVVGLDRVVNHLSISDDAVFDPEQAVQLTVVDTVLFSTGRADVSEQYGPLIDLAVEILEAREHVTLEVVGHTDDVGEDETNLHLSIARAEATRDQVIARGINPNRITTEGRGETEPLESNDTEVGRQTNRRVEFLVTGTLR